MKFDYKKLLKLSKEQIHNNTVSLSKREREIQTALLYYFREVRRRKIFAEKGYFSLHEYMQKELGYSEGAAQRRIAAMKLIQILPEAEQSLQEGKVSLTHLSKLQTFIQHQEKKQKEKKQNEIENKNENENDEKLEKNEIKTEKQGIISHSQLLQNIEGKSTREAEKLFASLDPQMTKPDRERNISDNEINLNITINQELKNNLEKIKNLASNKLGNCTYQELFSYMSKIVLEKIDPIEKEKRAQARLEKKAQKQEKKEHVEKKVENESVSANTNEETPAPVSARGSTPASVPVSATVSETMELQSENKRAIPAEIKRKVFIRDGGQCASVNPVTKKRCECRKFLQYEHCIPYAVGGRSDDINNIVLICPEHNKLEAIKFYGEKKMSEYYDVKSKK